MIDNILFNKIAAYLSLIKEIKKPFGKIQLILCGDFYQLPPITNTYCFNSNIWNKLNLRKVELKKQMRQINDEYFQYVLEQVKINNITNDIFLKLSELKNKTIHKDIKPTILYSKNIDVEKINQNEFLTEKEARELLQKKATWFWQMRKDGLLPFRKIGKSIYYSKKEINHLLETSKQK